MERNPPRVGTPERRRVGDRVAAAASASVSTMTRRCSHCSNNGHNSRTCPTRGAVAGPSAGVMLFGVRLTDGSMMKKSASMGNLSAHLHSSSASPNPGSPDPAGNHIHVPDGYLSDDTAHRSSHRRGERKKGIADNLCSRNLFLFAFTFRRSS